jgi:hypothetical protein
VLVREEFGRDIQCCQFGNSRWSSKLVNENIVLVVIADEMLMNSIDQHRHGFLDKTVGFEAITVP